MLVSLIMSALTHHLGGDGGPVVAAGQHEVGGGEAARAGEDRGHGGVAVRGLRAELRAGDRSGMARH